VSLLVPPPALWVPPRPAPIPLLTKRLRIDWWRPEHAPSLWEAIETSRTTLIPWLPWAATGHRDPDETLERIEAWTRLRQAPEADEFFVGLFERATGEIVGGSGLHLIVPELAQAEIGYWVRATRREQGLCTEAVRALVTSAFRDWRLRRVVVQCAGDNVPSRRVAEKVGLPLEAVHRRARWIDDHGWSDGIVFAALADEWDLERERRKDGVPARRA
jgi:ribosomal-protein-serine acetyltransferase